MNVDGLFFPIAGKVYRRGVGEISPFIMTQYLVHRISAGNVSLSDTHTHAFYILIQTNTFRDNRDRWERVLSSLCVGAQLISSRASFSPSFACYEN